MKGEAFRGIVSGRGKLRLLGAAAALSLAGGLANERGIPDRGHGLARALMSCDAVGSSRRAW